MAAMTSLQLLLLALLSTVIDLGASQNLFSQNNTWNSSFSLTPSQIAAANLSDDLAHDFEVAVRYERTNQAGSLTVNDPFYDLPNDYDASNPPPPGTPIKAEQYTNVTLYTLPMTLAMSRFLYMTETLNGSSAPASAYVLWPYHPRPFDNLTRSYSAINATAVPQNNTDNALPLFPTIGLAHGTSGFTPACAPSNLRDLWGAPATAISLALNGYAVVATDYLGLGVRNETSPYFVLPSQANDVFRAVEAAQRIWPGRLSKEFVIDGHSQGGGTAWAGAHRQAEKPVEGYLGAMAASPFPSPFEAIAHQDAAQVDGRVLAIAQGMSSVYPGFELSEWLTDAGIARLRLMEEANACGPASGVLFGAADGPQILKHGWNKTASALWYSDVATMKGKPLAGPMLVIQGTEDGNAYEPSVTDAVELSCSRDPGVGIEYVRMENVTHTPVLYAGQYKILDWIRERFEGRKVQGCANATWSPSRGERSAEFGGFKGQTWFLEWDVYGI